MGTSCGYFANAFTLVPAFPAYLYHSSGGNLSYRLIYACHLLLNGYVFLLITYGLLAVYASRLCFDPCGHQLLSHSGALPDSNENLQLQQ